MQVLPSKSCRLPGRACRTARRTWRHAAIAGSGLPGDAVPSSQLVDSVAIDRLAHALRGALAWRCQLSHPCPSACRPHQPPMPPPRASRAASSACWLRCWARSGRGLRSILPARTAVPMPRPRCCCLACPAATCWRLVLFSRSLTRPARLRSPPVFHPPLLPLLRRPLHRWHRPCPRPLTPAFLPPRLSFRHPLCRRPPPRGCRAPRPGPATLPSQAIRRPLSRSPRRRRRPQAARPCQRRRLRNRQRRRRRRRQPSQARCRWQTTHCPLPRRVPRSSRNRHPARHLARHPARHPARRLPAASWRRPAARRRPRPLALRRT